MGGLKRPWFESGAHRKASMRIRSNLRLPKEHGAWAMLYVPFVIGVLVAARVNLRVVLLFLSTSFLFIARESLLVWWRGRQRGQKKPEAFRTLIIYVGLATLFGAPLLFPYGLYWLAPTSAATVALMIFNAFQATRRADRTIGGEIVAILGMTLTGPSAYYAATGEWNRVAAWLWVLAALYFTSSVFYVKLRVHWLNKRKDEQRKRAWRLCATYHAFLLAGLVGLGLTGSLNLFAVVAFAPILGRSFWHLFRPTDRINLKRIGVTEIAYSVVFLVFITLTLRMS